MALLLTVLTCDECERRFATNWTQPGDIMSAAAGDGWIELDHGVFCPRCVAKAARGTLVVQSHEVATID